MYSVHVTISDSDDRALNEFNDYVEKVSDDLHNGGTTLENVPYREVIYTLRMEDSRGRWQVWSVCQCIGFAEECEIPEKVEWAVASKELALLPRGGAAHLLESNHVVKGSQIFCFLPLPTREGTKFPVHINGHFALDSARRTLWDDGRSSPGYKSMWNSLMMKKIVAQAHVSLVMNECRKLNGKQSTTWEELRKFYSIFPDIANITFPYLNELVSGFYTNAQFLSTKCLAVQTDTGNSVVTRWFDTRECEVGDAFFDNLSPTRVIVTRFEHPPAYTGFTLTGNQQPVQRSTVEIDHFHSLTNILQRLGFNLLCVPMFIYHSLQKIKIKVRQVEPNTVLDYLYNYRSYTDCTLKCLPLPVTESPFQDIPSVVVLARYCYKDHTIQVEEKDETKSLADLPLCVTADEMLQEFSRTEPRYYPRFSSLVPNHADQFVDLQIYDAIPFHVCEKKPLALVGLTIEKLAPLFLTSHSFLMEDYRLEWDPTKEWKKWLANVWELINDEIDRAYADLRKNRGIKNDRNWVQERETALKRLEPLKQFCIIPAHDIGKRKHFLYQLKYAKCVRDESALSMLSAGDHDTIQKLLDEAGVPQLYIHSLNFMPASRLPLPKEIVSHVNNPHDILYALCKLLQQDASAKRLKQVTENQNNANYLREYFTHSFKNKCTTEEAGRLQELPIHEFVNGDISALNNYGCYIVPKGIPKAGLDNWYSRNTPEKFIFQTHSDVDQWYKTLGVVEMTKVDLYVKLILQKTNFQTFLRKKEQLEHLDHIAEKVLPQLNPSSREYKALVASLQELPFLKNHNGDFELTRKFFDPNIPLFKAMETNFPPKIFCSRDRLDFLELCGLRVTVTGQDLVRYAEEVEEEGERNPTMNNEDQARLICKELEDHDEPTLFKLKDIEFLPVGKVPPEFSNMQPQFHRGQNTGAYISFQDSVMYKDFELCWTVASVLPAWLGPLMTSGKLQKSLGVQDPVSIATTVQHCIKLTRRLSRLNLQHNIYTSHSITAEMNIIYEHLGKMAVTVEVECLKKLKNEPCNSLVFPHQVAVSLSLNDQILPYLHKLPETLWKHIDTMRHIGVEIDINHHHYMMVLKMIKDEVGDSDLEADPNKMIAADKAIWKCLPLLSQVKEIQSDIPLYLRSHKKKLMAASELYLVDRPSWGRRIADIGLHILYVPEDLSQLHYLRYIEKIPEPLCPKKLSELLEEVLDDNSLVTISQEEDGAADWFRNHFESDEFRSGLQRLLLHDALKQDYGENFDQSWSELMKRLMKVQFHSVERLITVLKYKTGDIIPRTNSESQKVYVKTSTIGCEVYVAKHARKPGHSLSSDVQQQSKLLKRIIKESFLPLKKKTKQIFEILLRTSKNDISTMLDDFNVTACATRICKMHPRLGDFIPLDKHCLLAPDFMQFFPGEYIGFELHDPLNEGREGQATYIYAKVLKALQFDDTELEINRQYEINIGERQVCVFSSAMYKFSRPTLMVSGDDAESQVYDIEKIRHQIAADLDYAFYKLSEEERNRVLKRMVMKWQPDNHSEHRETAEEVLRFIDEKIKQIENDANGPEPRGMSGKIRWFDVSHISAYASQRAKEQREQIREQRRRLQSNDRARAVVDDPDDYSYLSESGRNPQLGEAGRWYRQARVDLEASLEDISNGHYEWALYKCHQVS
jgi:sacsin